MNQKLMEEIEDMIVHWLVIFYRDIVDRRDIPLKDFDDVEKELRAREKPLPIPKLSHGR